MFIDHSVGGAEAPAPVSLVQQYVGQEQRPSVGVVLVGFQGPAGFREL